MRSQQALTVDAVSSGASGPLAHPAVVVSVDLNGADLEQGSHPGSPVTLALWHGAGLAKASGWNPAGLDWGLQLPSLPTCGLKAASPGTSLTSADLHWDCFLILLDQAEKNRKNH